jgi:hypothetical protein
MLTDSYFREPNASAKIPPNFYLSLPLVEISLVQQ